MIKISPSILAADFSKLGEELKIDIVGGNDFPDDLSAYDIVIHCGACMFNRRTVLSRVRQAKAQGVPITNYGIAIAQMNGILKRSLGPFPDLLDILKS